MPSYPSQSSPGRIATPVRGAVGLQTFMAATALFTPAATATDIWTITGSASKVVRLLRVIFSGTQTTAGNLGTFALIKRSALDTTGTFVASTAVPVDSAQDAATSVVGHYTANPGGLGAAVGTIYQPRGLLAAPATAAPGIVFDLDTTDLLGGKPITLRGAAENIALNCGGGALPTGAALYQVTCVWTEETAAG